MGAEKETFCKGWRREQRGGAREPRADRLDLLEDVTRPCSLAPLAAPAHLEVPCVQAYRAPLASGKALRRAICSEESVMLAARAFSSTRWLLVVPGITSVWG